MLYVALGGFIGSILRFFLAVQFNKHPIATWIVNMTGSLLLAFLLRNYLNGSISWELWLFAGVGLSGAYTTFSTFSNEVMEYLMNKQFYKAASYAGVSFVTALLTVYIVLSI